MSDINKYTDFGLSLGGVSAPFEGGSLEIGNDAQIEDIVSGNGLTPDLRQVVGKKPFLRATLLDPSLVAAWQKVAAGESITSISAAWRCFDSFGGHGSSYISAASSLGVIMPVSLSGSPKRKATLEVLFLAAFSGGTALTIGTASIAQATVTKAFYPTNFIIGGDTIIELESLQVNWEYQLQEDEQLEPAYYYYDRYNLRGTFQCRRTDKMTAARLEDGAYEVCSCLFTDANDGGNTVTVSFGTCHVMAATRGMSSTFNVTKVV